MKKTILKALLLFVPLCASAQSTTNSPYSQFGLGSIAETATGFNTAMGGVGLGFRDGKIINPLNPASYSAVDSLTMLFDAGMSLQVTNFQEGATRLNAQNSSFDYFLGSFRLMKNMGVAVGVLPYSNVGYSFSNTETIGSATPTGGSTTTYTNSYSGTGGLHQVFVGMGYSPVKGISVGFNAGYLWGSYTRTVTNSYSDYYVNTLSKYYLAEVASYNVDFGAQVMYDIDKKNSITLGATVGLGHNLGCDPECLIISTNSQTSVSDTTRLVAKDGLSIPLNIGVGVAYNRENKLRVGLDYKLSKWADEVSPVYSNAGGVPTYEAKTGLYNNVSRIALGAEYCPNDMGRTYLHRIHYKAGLSYTSPYLNIMGKEGPKQISLSAGFAIPFYNINTRPVLNISAQWTKASAQDLIKENTFRINVGLTFNERWFAKYKVD